MVVSIEGRTFETRLGVRGRAGGALLAELHGLFCSLCVWSLWLLRSELVEELDEFKEAVPRPDELPPSRGAILGYDFKMGRYFLERRCRDEDEEPESLDVEGV